MIETTIIPIESTEHAVAPHAVPPAHRKQTESKQPFDIFDELHAKLSPGAFSFGLLLGFLACCLGGYSTTQYNLFKDFHRFHMNIAPETFFYPTTSELVAIARSRVKSDQVLVIVGGNSILNGVGHPVQKLWSNRLQQQLGPKFCVLNFAFRGTLPFEAGYFAFERMYKEHPKILYVTVSAPSICGNAEGGPIYGYFYWQARARGQLIADGRRDKEVAQRVATLQGGAADKMQELKIRSQIDAVCHFSDLWNAFTLNVASTVWHSIEKRPFKPRRKTVDEEPIPVPLADRFRGQIDREMPIARGVSLLLFERGSLKRWVPVKAFWELFDQQAETVIPKELHKHTMVVFSPTCPYYENRLTADEQERNRLANEYGRKRWEAHGYHCMVAADLNDEDHFDRTHLTASGGAKLASQLAPKLVDIAKTEGWVSE